jgi:mRNA interferase RelE/StbE
MIRSSDGRNAANADVAYALRYHPRVLDEDRKRVVPGVWARIGRAIETRLTAAPERYGEALAGSLRGYRKLRVGEYRVIFEIVDTNVRIIAILHRRDAYERVARRLG